MDHDEECFQYKKSFSRPNLCKTCNKPQQAHLHVPLGIGFPSRTKLTESSEIISSGPNTARTVHLNPIVETRKRRNSDGTPPHFDSEIKQPQKPHNEPGEPEKLPKKKRSSKREGGKSKKPLKFATTKRAGTNSKISPVSTASEPGNNEEAKRKSLFHRFRNTLSLPVQSEPNPEANSNSSNLHLLPAKPTLAKQVSNKLERPLGKRRSMKFPKYDSLRKPSKSTTEITLEKLSVAYVKISAFQIQLDSPNESLELDGIGIRLVISHQQTPLQTLLPVPITNGNGNLKFPSQWGFFLPQSCLEDQNASMSIQIRNYLSDTPVGQCQIPLVEIPLQHIGLTFGKISWFSWIPSSTFRIQGRIQLGLKRYYTKTSDSIQSRWCEENAGGSFECSKWYKSPQFAFSLSQTRTICLLLYSTLGYSNAIGFHLLRLRGGTALSWMSPDRLGEIIGHHKVFLSSPIVDAEVLLPEGEYIVIPCTKQANLFGSFVFHLLSTDNKLPSQIRLIEIPTSEIGSGNSGVSVIIKKPDPPVDDFMEGLDLSTDDFCSSSLTLSLSTSRIEEGDPFEADIDWDLDLDDSTTTDLSSLQSTPQIPPNPIGSTSTDDPGELDPFSDLDDLQFELPIQKNLENSEIVLDLWKALENNDFEILEKLLGDENLALDVNQRQNNSFGLTPVLFAATVGSIQLFEILFKFQANISLVDSKGENLIFKLFSHAQPEMFRFILNSQAIRAAIRIPNLPQNSLQQNWEIGEFHLQTDLDSPSLSATSTRPSELLQALEIAFPAKFFQEEQKNENPEEICVLQLVVYHHHVISGHLIVPDLISCESIQKNWEMVTLGLSELISRLAIGQTCSPRFRLETLEQINVITANPEEIRIWFSKGFSSKLADESNLTFRMVASLNGLRSAWNSVLDYIFKVELCRVNAMVNPFYQQITLSAVVGFLPNLREQMKLVTSAGGAGRLYVSVDHFKILSPELQADKNVRIFFRVGIAQQTSIFTTAMFKARDGEIQVGQQCNFIIQAPTEEFYIGLYTKDKITNARPWGATKCFVSDLEYSDSWLQISDVVQVHIQTRYGLINKSRFSV